MKLRCGRFVLDCSRPLVMGIVNLTPDSFSGDGTAGDTRRAIERAYRQIELGADIVDLGAESSRPGATATPLDEELARLLPVLAELADCGVPISIDTYKSEVMIAALDAGASMINDIQGFRSADSLRAVAGSACGVCVMHMRGVPLTMQQAPAYADVVAEVAGFLGQRVAELAAHDVAAERICVDPGFGFGKTLDHNLALLRELSRVTPVARPILVGLSRKSMFGDICGRPPAQRVAASVAAGMLAVQRGARILRVHDVAETRDALAVLAAVDGIDEAPSTT